MNVNGFTRTAVILTLLAAAGFGQTPDAIRRVKTGQTWDELVGILGAPASTDEADQTLFRNLDWNLEDGKVLRVGFYLGHVTSVKTVKLKEPKGPSRWSKVAEVLAAVAVVAVELSYQQSCNAVYHKPVLLMTPSDWGLLRGCSENGYWAWGQYVLVR